MINVEMIYTESNQTDALFLSTFKSRLRFKKDLYLSNRDKGKDRVVIVMRRSIELLSSAISLLPVQILAGLSVFKKGSLLQQGYQPLLDYA